MWDGWRIRRAVRAARTQVRKAEPELPITALKDDARSRSTSLLYVDRLIAALSLASAHSRLYRSGGTVRSDGYP